MRRFISRSPDPRSRPPLPVRGLCVLCCLSSLLSLAVPQPGFAQEQEADADSKPDKKEINREIPTTPSDRQPLEERPEIVRLTIDPAPEPYPALKYRLFPSRTDLKPGNAVPFYYRAILSSQEIPESGRKLFSELDMEFSEKPLSELRKPENRERIARVLFNNAIESNLEEAVSRESVDWDFQMNRLTGEEPITFLLPEMQESRSVARYLEMKARLEFAEGRFDDALHTIAMGLRMSRDVAEPPTLINDLVGIATAVIMLHNVREGVGEPGCPNLYWALATLPDPLVNLRDGLEYEGGMPSLMFPYLKDPETAEHSPEEWARLVRESFKTLVAVEGTTTFNKEFGDLPAVGLMMRGYPLAKRELIAAGMDAAKVEQMPAGQVIAIYQKRITGYIYDEVLKWSYLPYRESQERAERTVQRLTDEGYLRGGNMKEIIPIAALLLPAVQQVRHAEARIQVRVKGLMVLEAIRMHMAAHDGAFPQTLDDIDVVPVPNSPDTGEPFDYRVEGDTAILTIRADPRFKRVWWEMHLTRRQ